MSSILKALKKLDQEKASRPGRDADIAAAILRGDRPPVHRRWLVPTGMVTVAAAAVLATYLIMSHHPSQQLQQAAISDHAQKEVPATPASAPAAAVISGSSQQAAPSNMAAAPLTVSSPGVRTASKGLRQDTPAVTRPEPTRPVALQAVKSAEPQASKPPAADLKTRTNTAASATPALRLSGIAWQKDTASRLAVINGYAVSQGAVIDGAMVEEIMPDKVRFSIDQRTFEIPLGKIQN